MHKTLITLFLNCLIGAGGMGAVSNCSTLVYLYNTLTGEVELSEVTATFSLTSNHLNYLTIVDEDGNGQVIESTDVHPFWVVTDEPELSRAARSVVDENGVILYHENLESGLNGYWVEAKDLRVGDMFLGANGELSTLTNIVRVEQSGGIDVFNFTVEGNHNYFILAKEYEFGQTCILVHNATICVHKPGDDHVSKGLHVTANGVEVSLKPGNNGTIVLKPTFASTSARDFKQAKKIVEEALKDPATIRKLISNAEAVKKHLQMSTMQMKKELL